MTYAMPFHAYTQVNQTDRSALLIIGDARAGADKRFFDELHSSIPNSKIIVTGYVSNHDLPSYYSVVDVLCEAMACGKAVIATPVGGVLDVLNDCENGRIVAVNDVISFTPLMQEMMSDKEMQKHLGRSARQTVESTFPLQNELNGNLLLYRKLGRKV